MAIPVAVSSENAFSDKSHWLSGREDDENGNKPEDLPKHVVHAFGTKSKTMKTIAILLPQSKIV